MNLSYRPNVSDLLGDKRGSIEILARTCMSNHVLVALVLTEGTRRMSRSLHIPDSVHIDDALES